jgi:hypothetical protein
MLTDAQNMLILFSTCFMMISCFACSSVVKMEAIFSSEMLVQQTTLRYNPEDWILNEHS